MGEPGKNSNESLIVLLISKKCPVAEMQRPVDKLPLRLGGRVTERYGRIVPPKMRGAVV